MSLKLFLLLLVFSLFGCTYGYSVNSGAELIGNTYAPTEHVDTFFSQYRGEEVLEEIAIVRAVGRQYSGIPEILEELKKKAKSLGADAIIEIQVSEKKRRRGVPIADVVSVYYDLEDDKDEYIAKVLSGVAVKYVE